MNKLLQIFLLSICSCFLIFASGIKINYESANAQSNNPTSPQAAVPIYNAQNQYSYTYRASVNDLSPAASATDISTICGSSTKTILVTQIQASADASAIGSQDFYVFLRSASDVGGTSSVVSVAALDQTNSPSPTATATKWIENPSSVGSGVLIVGDHYAIPAATSTGYPVTQWFETFGSRGNQPIILRGTNQCVAFSLNGNAILSGLNIYVNWEWIEE